MSSIPGYTLEAFIAWQWNLVVEDEAENNFSVGVAEMIGTVKPRPRVTKEQFTPLVALYEPYRGGIEDRLLDFDDDTQSWRSYAGYVDCDVPESVNEQAETLVDQIRQG